MEKKYVYISFCFLIFLLIIYGLMILIPNKKNWNVVISNKDVVLSIGEKYQLSITKDYENLYWESSDESVVSIDSITGEIIGIKEGTASIRVSLLEDLNVYDNCVVKVKDNSDISISEKQLTLFVGDTYGINAIFNENYKGDRSIVWESDNLNVASVNKDGFITAKKVGTTNILARNIDGKVVKCEVTVLEKSIDITNVRFKNESIKLEVGDSKTLDIVVEPANATIKSISFDSSNVDIVAVNEKGKLLAIGPGKATIIAKINNDKTITCNVEVNKKEYIEDKKSASEPTSTPTPAPTPTPTPEPTPSPVTPPNIEPKKIDDQIVINYNTFFYTGTMKETTANSKSGLPVNLTYYSDSLCSNVVNPINVGTYYAVGKTTGNSEYNGYVTPCTKALSINKNDDQITINFKSVNYTGSRVETNAVSKSGLPVNLTFFSNSTCTTTNNNSNFLVEPGTYYAIGITSGNDFYKGLTTPCTKAVEIKGSYANSVGLNKNTISLNVGASYHLVASVYPSDAINKNITWKSSNSSIVTVNNNGLITGIASGNAVITASTSNGKTASVSVAVIGSELVDSYESSSLSYYIEKPDWSYIITHIWVKDAYNQMKVAITEPQNPNSLTPRLIQVGSELITNEINSKGYQNKGLIAVNGSGMVSTEFNENAPSHWFGTSALPYILNNGQVIRDSTAETLVVGKSGYLYGITKNGYLKSYYYTVNKDNILTDPIGLKTNLSNDGIRYTFGFSPVIMENGVKKISDSNTAKNIRQALCQIDRNNFIMFTSTVNMFERGSGLSMVDIYNLSSSMGCVTTFNFDGGGSTSYFYKYNSNDLKTIGTGSKITPGYGERGLSDMVYFVEK